jgi:hypothetical protein
LLLVLILHLPQNRIRGKKRDAEFMGDARAITRIESCNGLRPSVYCGLEHCNTRRAIIYFPPRLLCRFDLAVRAISITSERESAA